MSDPPLPTDPTASKVAVESFQTGVDIDSPAPAVSNEATLADGDSVSLTLDGRPNVQVQYKNVTSQGDLVVETGSDGNWWPHDTVTVDSGEGFTQLPFVGDAEIRVTASGFAGDVRLNGA